MKPARDGAGSGLGPLEATAILARVRPVRWHADPGDRVLERAIQAVDLPALVLERYPDAGAHRGAYVRPDRAILCAVWRGEKTPSVSLTVKAGAWVWHDHGTHQGGNAFTWLVQVIGLTRAQAAQELLERAGLTDTPRQGSRPIQTKSDQLWREFRRMHPDADENFYRDWLELRAEGWLEIGAAQAMPATPWCSPILPNLPAVVLEHHQAARRFAPGTVTLEDHPNVCRALGVWLAASMSLEMAHGQAREGRAA